MARVTGKRRGRGRGSVVLSECHDGDLICECVGFFHGVRRQNNEAILFELFNNLPKL